MTEHCHDRVTAIENNKSAMQVGDRDVIALNGYRSGHAETGDDFFNKLAFEAVMQQSALGLMVAITDQKPRRLVSCVERHAVRGVELLWSIPFLPEV